MGYQYNCGNTRESSGVLPYHLVEANEKGAFFGFGRLDLIFFDDWQTHYARCPISTSLVMMF